MKCNSISHAQRMQNFCPICQQEQLDNIEKMLKTIQKQINNIEEYMVPKIEEEIKISRPRPI